MRARDHGEWDQIAKTLEGADDEASKKSLIGKNAAIPRNLPSFMMSENTKSHGCIDAGVIPVNPGFLSSSHHLLATFAGSQHMASLRGDSLASSGVRASGFAQ